MESSTFELIRFGRVVFGSTCRSIRPGLSSTTAKDRLRFIRRIFSCAESNAYITNTLNKLILTRVLQVSYFCHVHTACIDLLEKKWREETFGPLASRARNDTCLKERVGKQTVWWRSVSHAFESTTQMNPEGNRRQERTGRGTAMFLWE